MKKFTITFDVGGKKGIPLETEAPTEEDAIADFKAYLAGVGEDENWDGWYDDLTVSFDGEPPHRLVFQPKWVNNFEVFEGTKSHFGHRIWKK